MTDKDLRYFLEESHTIYNQKAFIEADPISIPHQYQRMQDIEITAFWTAMLAWGQRKTIINKANELFAKMDHAPYDFMVNHEERDRIKLLDFKHRTFQATDTIYFITFLQDFYQKNISLEDAFLRNMNENDPTTENALRGFRELFFSLPDAPTRTHKHIATPKSGSTCKRLNMFLRWMVRQDDKGVDFGCWKGIKPSQLLIPLDVHVDRVARKLGLLHRPQTDWLAVLELTERLRFFNAEDPVRYDFSLFGVGVERSGLPF